MQLSDDFIAKLKRLAARETWQDDADKTGELMNPCEYSGGNFDDAYYGGQSDGETDMARAVLEELGVPYKDQS